MLHTQCLLVPEKTFQRVLGHGGHLAWVMGHGSCDLSTPNKSSFPLPIERRHTEAKACREDQ